MGRSIDKRNFYRIKVEKFKVKYRIINSDSKGVDVDVVNISAGGICFLRDTSVYKGEEVEVLFPFKTKKIILRAEILRIEGREVGIRFITNKDKVEEFLDVFNTEYKLIKDYTDNKMKTSSIYPENSSSEYSEKEKAKDDKDMFKI